MQRILIPILSLIGLAILCLVCLQCHAPHIEAELNSHGQQALTAAGLDPAMLTIEGRDATLTGSVVSDAVRNRAGELVAQLRGIRVVDNRLTFSDSAATSGTAQNPDASSIDRSGSATESSSGAGGVTGEPTSSEEPGSDVEPGSTGEAESGIEPGSDVEPGSGVEPGFSGKPGSGIEPGSGVEPESGIEPESDDRTLQSSLDAVLRDSVVEFATNSDNLTTKGRATLDRVYVLLAAQPGGGRIAISGHTDLTGSQQFNADLSKLRAQAAVAYLVSKGLPAERFATEGYGATRPIADNDTEEGRQKNRRIEIQVVEDG